MNDEQSALWQRLQQFELDDPSAELPFSARLARDNGWSRGFARRVVAEYKRFLFLAMVEPGEVTPSDQVDEAWHLHLTYTHSYWDGLCRDVLGRPLHHVPTRGTSDDAVRYPDQYRQTLASYQPWFGHAPPADIWPPPEIRFGEDIQQVRVNRARAWIIPKPRLWTSPRRAAPWIAGAWALPLAWGIANPLDLQGPEFLAAYAIISIMALTVAILLRQLLRQNDPGDDERPLAPIEVACLSRGTAGVLQAGLASLIARKKLEVVKKSPWKLGPIRIGNITYALRAVASPSEGEEELERVVLASAADPNGADTSRVLKDARPIAETIESELQSRGLLESPESFGPARWWPLLIVGGVMMLGMAKLFVGVSRDKPVAFLVMMLIALAIAMVWLGRRPLRTRQGQRLLYALQRQHADLKNGDFTSSPEESYANVVLAAGLFGLTAVSHPDIQQLHNLLRVQSSSTAAGAGGCGCGGGGCGGCGGCGG